MKKETIFSFIIVFSALAAALICSGGCREKKKEHHKEQQQSAAYITAALSPTPLSPYGNLSWVKHAGGGSPDGGRGISALPDGSAIVTGYFDSTATFGAGEGNETVLSSAGSRDIFIAKYNPDGTLAWAKSAGGGGGDEGRSISALSDGSAIVTGNFGGAATFGPGEGNETVLSTAGGVDIFIAKYNPDGTLAWAKSAGGSDWDIGYGVSVLSDGSAIVTGSFFRDPATFGAGEGNETVLTSAGSQDIFIAKYNPDGTLAWAKGAGGASSDYGKSISALSDGSALVTGDFGYSDGGTAIFGAGEGNETVLSSAGSRNIFIAKYNPDGTLAWVKSAGGGNNEEGNGVSALSDGSAIVTGKFEGIATFGAGEEKPTALYDTGWYSMFIAKYNPDGTLAWAKKASGIYTGSCDGCDISSLSDGSALVTGHFEGAIIFGAGEENRTVFSSAGRKDIFIAKYNPDGTLAWAKSAGGGSGDYCYSISALSDGSALVTGRFINTATFGAGEGNETDLVSVGGSDIFIAKFNP